MTRESLLNYEQVIIDRPVAGDTSTVTFRYLSLDEYDIPQGSLIGVEFPSYYVGEVGDQKNKVTCSYSVADAKRRDAIRCTKSSYIADGGLPAIITCETPEPVYLSRAAVLRVFCENIPLPPEGQHTEEPLKYNHEGKITVITPQEQTLFTHRLEFPVLNVIAQGDPRNAYDRVMAILYISGKRSRPFSTVEIEQIRNALDEIFVDDSQFVHYQSLLLPDPITEEGDEELVTTAFQVTSDSFDPDEIGFVALALQKEIFEAVKKIAPDLDKVITGGYVVPLMGTCFNNQRDMSETDRDCSRSCLLCPLGALCNNDLDCEYGYCRFDKRIATEFEKRYSNTIPAEGRHRPFSGRSDLSDDISSYFPRGRCHVNTAFYTGITGALISLLTILVFFM